MNITSSVVGSILLAAILVNPAIAQDSISTEYESLQVNGITLAYRDIGGGNALVLLHGFQSTGQQWDPYIEDLADKYRLIIPDLRGHGRSLNPSGKFITRELAQDVLTLLDLLGIDSFSAIGTSMGAMTLLHAATIQRERVDLMVLVGGTPYFPETARAIYRSVDPDSIPPERLTEMARGHSGGVEQVLQLQRQFSSYKDSYDDMNFTVPYLASINASTLIVQGDRDPLFPVPVAIEMYDAIPNSYLWIVPNKGHDAGLRTTQGREIFIDTALDFLAGNWESAN